MSAKPVLGIDFGTTNSYYCLCPAEVLTPRGIDFKGRGRDGFATAILYRKGKRPLIGDMALEEYGEASEVEKVDYKIRTQFKPELARGEEARELAKDFLASVLVEARTQHLEIEPIQHEVLFGIPSEADNDYQKALAEVARIAGYGNIKMVGEPIGALVDHIFHKHISVYDSQKDILVIDFGGGTCDFAYLRRGKIEHPWGDMNLGGRLFDDLFFQWFVEQNPEALQRMRNNADEFYVHFYICREIKESFSTSMARDRTEPVRGKGVTTGKGGLYGHLKNMTWNEFLQRARNYSPSETFRRYLQELGVKDSHLLRLDGPVDLLEWFRHSLKKGLEEAGLQKTDIQFVILAGGSSLWPFVPEIVAQELGLEEGRIMRVDRPYTVIAEGIALIPALKRRLQAAYSKLGEEHFRFRNATLREEFKSLAKQFTQEITQQILSELFDIRLRFLLEEFRTEGGAVADLNKKLDDAVSSYSSSQAPNILAQKYEKFQKVFSSRAKQLIQQWFADQEVACSEQNLLWGEIRPRIEIPSGSCRLGGFLINTIRALRLEKLLQKIWKLFRGNFFSWVITEKRIARMRNQLEDTIKSSLQNEFDNLWPEIEQKLEPQIRQQIESLREFAEHLEQAAAGR